MTSWRVWDALPHSGIMLMYFQGRCVLLPLGWRLHCVCVGAVAVVSCTCALCPEKSGFWWLIIQGKRCFFYAEGARHENGWCCHNEHGR